MLKILVGIGLGFLLFNNLDARQVTAELLRAAAAAIDPIQPSPAQRSPALQDQNIPSAKNEGT